jgi:hypothetical protein
LLFSSHQPRRLHETHETPLAVQRQHTHAHDRPAAGVRSRRSRRERVRRKPNRSSITPLRAPHTNARQLDEDGLCVLFRGTEAFLLFLLKRRQ